MALMENYYAAVDGGDIDRAMTMLAVDAEFSMVLPNGENRGQGREWMRSYLEGRPPVNRRHVVTRSASDGDLAFAQGHVTENDEVITGHFVGVMHVDADGLIDRYQVVFSPDFAALPTAEQSGAQQ